MARELAILVTARNMASGALNEVRGDIKGIQAEAKRGVTNTVRNVGLIGAAAAGAIAVNVKAGIDSLAELERMTAQTNAVIKSTGGIAGLTAAEIRGLAEEYENLTTVDDKAIQNTENLLLTFTNVRKEAFEPALAAILDMNAAMGGDENSLESIVIQVGKALNDPIKGITALSRVGVTFTEQQKEQIKELVEANKVYEAQTIILNELGKEFGGSAAAQADTFQGKMKRVADAVEGAQVALATAFLPVLEKVADKMETFLSDPNTLKNIEDFGGTLADGLDDAIAMVERLPWDAIGNAFSIMGQGARTVLDMFTKMPPWVQTAILTGWGLNKLSGGALGNIVGQLGSGLIKGVLGMNAGVVNAKAGVVNVSGPTTGGGGGAGGRPGRRGFNPFFGLLAGITGAAIGAEVAMPEFERTVAPGRNFMTGQVDRIASGGSIAQMQDALDSIENEMFAINDGQRGLPAEMAFAFDIGGFKSTFKDQKALLEQAISQREAQLSAAGKLAASSDRAMLQTAEVVTEQRNQARLAAAAVAADQSMLNSVRGQTGLLSQIRDKRTVFNPNVSVTANIANTVILSAQQTIYRLNSQRQSLNAGTSVSGFI